MRVDTLDDEHYLPQNCVFTILKKDEKPIHTIFESDVWSEFEEENEQQKTMITASLTTFGIYKSPTDEKSVHIAGFVPLVYN